ncbi:MAG: HAD family hydrolase [Rhodobacteraceae bacterium]|nr:HAD family hydrolase [Paracoccaceae bacterium]
MRTVIFDLDGTLADTSADLIASANYCFREMGLGDLLDPVADAGVAFRGGRAMLALGMARSQQPDAAMQVEAYYPVLLRAYGAAIDVHTRLYPGAIEAVEALKAGGYRVGICTNKPEALAETLLSQERARFDEGVSDQFLLIAREKTTLEARLKTIDAKVDVLRHELALNATLASLHDGIR